MNGITRATHVFLFGGEDSLTFISTDGENDAMLSFYGTNIMIDTANQKELLSLLDNCNPGEVEVMMPSPDALYLETMFARYTPAKNLLLDVDYSNKFVIALIDKESICTLSDALKISIEKAEEAEKK